MKESVHVLVQQLSEPNKTPIKIFLNKNEVEVGRKTMPALLQFYHNLSRYHARFTKSAPNSIFVMDLDSTYGLFINGIKIGKGRFSLNVGDVIGFGVPSLVERDGFVCVLEKVLKEDPVIYDISDDETEEKKGSSAENSNNAKEISIKLLSNASIEPLPKVKNLEKDVKHFENCVEPVGAVNGNKTFQNIGISEIQSIASCSSYLPNDNSGHGSNILLNILNSSPSNRVITLKSAEICKKQSFVSNFRSSNEGDIPKHTAEVNCDVPSFSELNRNEISPEPPKIKYFALNPTSSDRRDNSEHSSDIEHDIVNTSALIKGNAPEYSEIFIKKPHRSDSFLLPIKGNSSQKNIECDHIPHSYSVPHSGNTQENTLDKFELTESQIVLKRDSTHFEIETECENSFKKLGIEEVESDTNFILPRKKRLRVLSDSSDDSDNDNSVEKKSNNNYQDFDYEENRDEFCYSQIEQKVSITGNKLYLDYQNDVLHRGELPSVQGDIAIREFVSTSDNNNIAKGTEISSTATVCGTLIMVCEESGEENDSEIENISENKLNSENLLFESSAVVNSSKTNSNENKVNTNKTVDKSIKRSLSIDPKPLKIRRREDSFIQQKKYRQTRTSKLLNTPNFAEKGAKYVPKEKRKRTIAAIKNNIAKSNACFKYKKKNIGGNELSVNMIEASKSNYKPDVSVAKKVAPVKTLREKFGSRMGFLTEDFSRKPSMNEQNTANELKSDKLKDNTKIRVLRTNSHTRTSSNVSKASTKVPLLVNREKPKQSSITDQLAKDTSYSQTRSTTPINGSILKCGSPEQSIWDEPSTSSVITPVYKESVAENPKIQKQTRQNQPKSKDKAKLSMKDSKQNDPSANIITRISNNSAVPLHPNDIPQAEVKFLPIQNAVRTEENQTQNVSLNPTTFASLSIKETEEFNRPISSNDASILKDGSEYSTWNGPSTTSVITSSNKAPVPANARIQKQTRWDQPKRKDETKSTIKDSRQNDPSGNSITRISNNLAVPLHPTDPLQARINFLPIRDSVRTKENQTQIVSLNPSTTSASLSIKETEEFNRPISSIRASVDNFFEIDSFIFIKKLINFQSIWLKEQADFEDQPPPPVMEGAVMLPLHNKSYDLYASAFCPSMMLEIWNSMYMRSRELVKNDAVNKFYFSVLSCENKSDYMEIICESIVADKVSYCPREGCMVRLSKDGASEENLFGYIFKHSSTGLETDSLKNSHWSALSKEWLTNARHWTFHVYVRQTEIPFTLGSLMKGNGICNIIRKLSLADALCELKHSPLLQSIIKPEWGTSNVDYSVVPATREYTSIQMTAINGMVSAVVQSETQPKILLLGGPPGTGKTHTIIGLLRKLVIDCKQFFRILVVAPSNAAVDEIGCRLIDLNEQIQWMDRDIKFVRVGAEKQIHEKIRPYLLSTKCEELFNHNLKIDRERRNKEIKDLKNKIALNMNKNRSYDTDERLKYLKNKLNQLEKKYIAKEMDYETEWSYKQRILKESHIVLSTLNSCGSSILNRTFKSDSDVQFSCCIIDESTQCIELEVLKPLTFGIRKLILVGDQKEMPSTVTSKLAREFGFGRSMFERLHLFFEGYFHKSPVVTLIEQFRMHSQICEFPSKQFYNGQLIGDPRTDARYINCSINPYIVLDVTDSRAPSQINCLITEASVIVYICKSLLNLKDAPSSIGIITFGQGQRSSYEKALKRNPSYRAVEINSVEGFKGREKEVIIMSCGRPNSQSGDLGLLACRNHLSVALTRAKKCLIICCHASALEANNDWKSLISDARRNNVFYKVESSGDISHIFLNNIIKTK